MKKQLVLITGVVITAFVLLQSQVGAQIQDNNSTIRIQQNSQSNTQRSTQSNVVVTSVQQRNIHIQITPGSGQAIPTITIPPFQPVVPTGFARTLLHSLQGRLDTSLERRMLALQDVIARIKANPHLTEEQKMTIVEKLEEALKTLETTERSAERQGSEQGIRSLAQNLTQVGVYSCDIPAAHLTGATNSLENAKTRISQLVMRLDTLIAQLEAEGQDVTELKTQVAELKEHIEEAEEELEQAKSRLAEAQSTAMAACSQALGRVRSELAQANAQLVQAGAQIQKIKTEFQQLEPSLSSAPSAN